MNRCSRSVLHVAVSLFWLLPAISDQQDVDIGFPSFTLRNLTLVGDAFIRGGAVGLTRELGVPAASAGAFYRNVPVKLADPETNTAASFTTRFSFAISNINRGDSGDGLAFFLSSHNRTLGRQGSHLGLFHSSPAAVNVDDGSEIVAVEFDTKFNPEYGDPRGDHVGLDIGGARSAATAECADQGIDLRSGELITAWIEYEDLPKTLMVWLSHSDVKPQKPILSVNTAISKYYQEHMYVGFAGSKEVSTENHLVLDWTFQSYGVKTMVPNPAHPQHNVSSDDTTVLPPPSLIVDGFPNPSSGHGSGARKKLFIMLVVAGPAIICVVLVLVAWYATKKWKGSEVVSIKSGVLKGPREFTYREIKAGTRNFHASRIVGRGAFGAVYKAVFADSGQTFAVKRSKRSHEGKDEFLAELSVIACLRHKNLLQLQGYCAERDELFLVYEFMQNGSLDKALQQEGVVLTWAQRYNIALGIASALSYLHEECEQRVIHRDVKTSNIMLDANFAPRLGDFGLARLMDHDKSPVSTLTAGTMGYLAPEYLQYGKATEKTDVFSFGVVILELACGRRPIEKDGNGGKMVNLVDWVWELYGQDRVIEAADPKLNGEFAEEEMNRMLLLGLNCANPDFSVRPNMRRAMQMLSYEAELLSLSRKKPSLTFSSDLPATLQEIVAECRGPLSPASDLYEIKIER